ncbi:MAG: hypothetical protein QXG15_02500 [Desulfurococcaceae archaeon]
MQKSEELLSKLDEAVALIDKIEMFISRLKPGDEVPAGIVYQVYESLVLLKERIFEIRLIIIRESEKGS